jgi:hypothetical protein
MSAVTQADQMNDAMRIQALQAALDQANLMLLEQREVMQLALDALNEVWYSNTTSIAHQKFTLATEALREVLGEAE